MKTITASKIASAPLKSSGLMWLEKATSGQVIVEDIGDALEEFGRLFKAGISSKAEILTLARAFPENRKYTEAASKVGEDEPMVVGGPASVSLIDREGHLITTDALKRAFAKFMSNFRTRNAMVLHSDVQVGWALPAYITKGGQIFKSGVDDKGLFFICELRDDTRISEKVMKEISEGRLKSYSIAGSALKVQNMQKGLVPYMQVDEMELAEVTVCEKGVNQNAGFELLKAEMPQTGKIDKDQCDYRDATMEETMRGENCGHCKFFNPQDKTCDTVTGDIQPGDWCKIFAPMEEQPKHAKVVVVMRDKQKVDFKKSFDMWMAKAETVKDPLKAKESMATLQNFAGREAEHHQLLREYGFPSEQPFESSRYTPVVETETDDKGIPKNLVAPWTVNEAGQELGEKLDEDSPDYHLSDKAKNRKSGDAVQKMCELFLDKALSGNTPSERLQTYREQQAKEKLAAQPPQSPPVENFPERPVSNWSDYEGGGLAAGVQRIEDKPPLKKMRWLFKAPKPQDKDPEFDRVRGRKDEDERQGRGPLNVEPESPRRKTSRETASKFRDAARTGSRKVASGMANLWARRKAKEEEKEAARVARQPFSDTSQDKENIIAARQRAGGTGQHDPAPGYVDSPRGHAESVGQQVKTDADKQAAHIESIKGLNPQAARNARIARSTKNQRLGRLWNRGTLEGTDVKSKRGEMYTGAPGQKLAETVAGKQKRERQEYLQEVRATSDKDEQAKKQQAGVESRARRGGLRGALTRAKQRTGRGAERGMAAAGRGMETARRIGSEFGAGVKESVKPAVYSSRQRKDELSPKEEQKRADKSGTSKWQQRGREVGRGAASLYRGFKDKPDEQGKYMGYRGEGKRGQKQRELGRKGRAAYDWASGSMPFFSEEAKAKRAADKQFAGSAVQPGGPHGRSMEYDDHVGEFKGHNQRVQSTGHDTHENFLHNIQRLGMTKDNQTMFNIRHGKNVGSKMGDTVHAHDFLAGEGKDWDIEIHPDFAQHANEIHSYINEYKTHMAGAPGRGVGPTHGGGAATQTMDWKTQPSATAQIPHGPQQPAGSPIVERGQKVQSLGAPGGTQTSQSGNMQTPAQRQAAFLATPPDQDTSLKSVKKLTKAQLLDSMLLKAIGVRYATKDHSKTN